MVTYRFLIQKPQDVLEAKVLVTPVSVTWATNSEQLKYIAVEGRRWALGAQTHNTDT